jgi:hypothetical protein
MSTLLEIRVKSKDDVFFILLHQRLLHDCQKPSPFSPAPTFGLELQDQSEVNSDIYKHV